VHTTAELLRAALPLTLTVRPPNRGKSIPRDAGAEVRPSTGPATRGSRCRSSSRPAAERARGSPTGAGVGDHGPGRGVTGCVAGSLARACQASRRADAHCSLWCSAAGGSGAQPARCTVLQVRVRPTARNHGSQRVGMPVERLAIGVAARLDEADLDGEPRCEDGGELRASASASRRPSAPSSSPGP
jgi:hypothetical protein